MAAALTAFLEAVQTLLLGHAAAGAGGLAGRAGQGVEATQGAELGPLLVFGQLGGLQQLGAGGLPAPERLCGESERTEVRD